MDTLPAKSRAPSCVHLRSQSQPIPGAAESSFTVLSGQVVNVITVGESVLYMDRRK